MSRLILLWARKPGAKMSLMNKLTASWVGHLFSNKFLDSDLAFLYHQERILRRKSPEPDNWQQAYYMPGESDRSISAFRKWLQKEGALCATADFAAHLPQDNLTREQMFDRYSQHTAHCYKCQQALEGIARWQKRVGYLGVACFVLDRFAVGPRPLWVAAQILSLGAVVMSTKVEKQFRVGGYKHYTT
eukprot:TRINITY_DN34498_c0_g1_i1.p1 TRINITY_DN34498_c0_g1~~TRINITY_DN34498_c0_g1_i1.p1  ORF type:complete len:188 (+),score=24.97 TRINITY_DN34498_c0_g1_i1:106-669(+)